MGDSDGSHPAPLSRQIPALGILTLRIIPEGGQASNALAARDADRSWNGEDSHDSGTDVRRQASLSRECTYPDFMKYKPLYFKGTEWVVELTQWFERIETVFGISNCTMENQIKIASCTLLGSAITWWNSHVRTVGHDVVYAMTWTNLNTQMMTWAKVPTAKKLQIKKRGVEIWGKRKESDKIEELSNKGIIEAQFLTVELGVVCLRRKDGSFSISAIDYREGCDLFSDRNKIGNHEEHLKANSRIA
ncbi:hypothetical protein Tco_1402791 [Tanacetum coccineum]